MPYVSYTTEAFTLYSTLTLYVAFKKHVVVEVSRNARTHGNCDRPSRNANSKWALISDWAADFLYVRERHSLAARALISALPAHARSGVCVCVTHKSCWVLGIALRKSSPSSPPAHPKPTFECASVLAAIHSQQDGAQLALGGELFAVLRTDPVPVSNAAAVVFSIRSLADDLHTHTPDSRQIRRSPRGGSGTPKHMRGGGSQTETCRAEKPLELRR